MIKADYLILWLNGSTFLRYFQFNQIILKLQQFPDDFRCLLSALKVVILQKFMILFSTSFLGGKKTTCIFINKRTAQTINHDYVTNMLRHCIIKYGLHLCPFKKKNNKTTRQSKLLSYLSIFIVNCRIRRFSKLWAPVSVTQHLGQPTTEIQ